MPPKRRIMLEQRRALRTWAHQQHPKPSHKECIKWFEAQYNHRLNQSTVSESLGTHFEILDHPGHEPLSRSRLQLGQWPELEETLARWRQQDRDCGGSASNDTLREQARKIWYQLPQYANQPCPTFSVGWVQRFKQRHPISTLISGNQKVPKEGASGAAAEDKADVPCSAAYNLPEEDIYHMCETGLYWQMVPSKSSPLPSQPGIYNYNSWLSILLCTNSTGTDRLPIWIIGNTRNPPALRTLSLSTIGAVWRWNKKARINITIMSDWLDTFYKHIGLTRETLLTLDDLSIYRSSLELSPPPANIRISWHPQQSQCRYQPLYPRIITSFKVHYRRRWLVYMLQCYKTYQDPTVLVNLHLAVRWMVRSWNHDISNTNVSDCFRISPPLNIPSSLSINSFPSDLTGIYREVTQAGHIQDAIAISEFIDPIIELPTKEDQVIYPDNILEEVLMENFELSEVENEDEEGLFQPLQPQYTIQTARSALKVVIEFTEGCSDIHTTHLRAIERLERELEELDHWHMGYSSWFI